MGKTYESEIQRQDHHPPPGSSFPLIPCSEKEATQSPQARFNRTIDNTTWLPVQNHNICLVYQAQRGFLLFLTVNHGEPPCGGAGHHGPRTLVQVVNRPNCPFCGSACAFRC